MEKDFYRVSDVAKLLGVSRCKVYDMIKKEEIPSKNLGGVVLIPIKAYEKWKDEDIIGID